MASEQFVVFQLAQEKYAIPIGQVKEIIRYNGATQLHNALGYMSGIINLRGKIISIIDLAKKHSDGRLLALGGGGYNLEVVPVAWASALHLMRGEGMPEYLSPYWVEFFINLVGREPLSPPDIEINVGEQTRIRITAELERTLQALKEKVNAIYKVY